MYCEFFHKFIFSLSKRYKNLPALVTSLSLIFLKGLLYLQNEISFSLLNLSYVNLTIKLAKEPRKQEGKSFFSPTLHLPVENAGIAGSAASHSPQAGPQPFSPAGVWFSGRVSLLSVYMISVPRASCSLAPAAPALSCHTP